MRQLRPGLVHDIRCAEISRATFAYACSMKACTREWRPELRHTVSHCRNNSWRAWRNAVTGRTSWSMSCKPRYPRTAGRRFRCSESPGLTVAGKTPVRKAVCEPLSNDPWAADHSTWRATVAVTGADGLPAVRVGGQRAATGAGVQTVAAALAPTTDAAVAARAVKETLERNPPYGAQLVFENASATAGWNAPALAPWLEESIMRASRRDLWQGCHPPRLGRPRSPSWACWARNFPGLSSSSPGCWGAAFKRAWPERIPARRVCEETDQPASLWVGGSCAHLSGGCAPALAGSPGAPGPSGDPRRRLRRCAPGRAPGLAHVRHVARGHGPS